MIGLVTQALHAIHATRRWLDRVDPRRLDAAARAVQLPVVNGVIEGPIQQIHVTIALGKDVDAQGDTRLNARMRLLDPKGVPGFDVCAEGLLDVVRGADATVGDPDFDDAVRLSTDDLPLALALCSADTRALLVRMVRRGWRRDQSAWWRDDAVGEPDALVIELGMAVDACLALRRTQPIAALVEARMHDPVPTVAALAGQVALARRWLEPPALRALLAHPDPALAASAAAQLGDEGVTHLVAAYQQRHPLKRIHAAIQLAAVAPDGVVGLEATLIRGLDGPLRAGCIEALGRVGTGAALAHLRALSGTGDALKAIQGRRASAAGGVSLADLVGGELSVVDPDRTE